VKLVAVRPVSVLANFRALNFTSCIYNIDMEYFDSDSRSKSMLRLILLPVVRIDGAREEILEQKY